MRNGVELMSIKKRMFRSNMTILFTTLLSLMFVILVVLVLFEDSLESQFYAVSQTEIDGYAGEAAQRLEEITTKTSGWEANQKEIEQVAAELEQLDYQVALIADGEVIAGDTGEEMQEIAEFFEINDKTQVGIYSFRKATIVGIYLTDQDAFLAAVHFPDENWIASSLNKSFLAFLITVLFAGLGTIIVLMVLASFFTRRMNMAVMEPVELLVEGAERIKSGNLNEQIVYHGETEFEHVCETFNDMQSTILEDREQRIKTEKARTDMVTGISHDLRTPLTAIRGYIKGILDGVAITEEKRNTYLRTAYEATGEMDLLLQKLFDFSRLESGQMPFHVVKADLAEYVTSYVAQKEIVLNPEELEIVLHKEKEYFPEISIDVEQVRRILDNLLENSRKYAGIPVRVDISVKETEEDIILEWKDNGQGVPEEKLPRIFERFYRCDEARTKKGSGVGLYVVKYIMERHKGRVKAENESGLKITLYFPKKETKGEADSWEKY